MAVHNRKKVTANKSEKAICKLHKLTEYQRTLWVTCFAEQLLHTWDEIKEMIRKVDPIMYQVMAILHNMDGGKEHYHFAIKVTGDTRVSIEEMLAMVGVRFRIPGEDVTICMEGALQTCNEDKLCKGFESKALYMIHATPASEKDGKHPYKDTEIVSNLYPERVHDMVVERKQVHDNARKLSILQVSELDEEAYRKGYAFEDFEGWIDSLPFTLRQKSSTINAMRKRYQKGVMDAIADQGKEISRLAVFIKGDPDQGKTYAALAAFKDKETILIKEGGTGQYDEIKPTTEVIVVDDQPIKDVLNVTDTYRAQVSRRNEGRPWWCGHYVIITSNLSFDEWLDGCGVKAKSQHEAAKSRIFICHVEKQKGINRLFCDSAAWRGNIDKCKKTIRMFEEFRRDYDRSLASYVKAEKSFLDSVLGFGSAMSDISPASPYAEVVEDMLNFYDEAFLRLSDET